MFIPACLTGFNDRYIDFIKDIKERQMTQNDLKVEWHAGFSVDAAEIDTYQKKCLIFSMNSLN